MKALSLLQYKCVKKEKWGMDNSCQCLVTMHHQLEIGLFGLWYKLPFDAVIENNNNNNNPICKAPECEKTSVALERKGWESGRGKCE